MTDDSPLSDDSDDRCGATCRDGSPCKNHPVNGGDRCRMHGGAGSGAPERNQNALKTGLHADPADLLDHLAEHRPESYEWCERKFDSYIQRAPFEPGSAEADQLRQVVVQEYAIWQGLKVQIRGGIVVDDPEHPNAGGLGGTKENPANLPLDRAQRTVSTRLKELGVLGADEHADTAATGGSKAEALRELMQRADDVGADGEEDDDE